MPRTWRCFYPHAPGGARPKEDVDVLVVDIVSIRTPRAGRDRLDPQTYAWIWVSIRTPRAGRDLFVWLVVRLINGFYPHAPGGARPGACADIISLVPVSIRTPRAGRDKAKP